MAARRRNAESYCQERQQNDQGRRGRVTRIVTRRLRHHALNNPEYRDWLDDARKLLDKVGR